MGYDRRGPQNVFRSLRTVHAEDPAAIRQRVIEAVNEVAEADATVTYSFVLDGLRPRIGDWTLTGDPAIARGIRMLQAHPELWPAQSLQSFLAPPTAHQQAFISIDEIMPRHAAEQTPM